MRNAFRPPPLLSLLPLALALVAACGEPAVDDDDDTARDTADAAHADSVAHAAAGDSTAHEAMELLPVMQLLGSHMAALSHALWREDWSALERRASSIANHPHLTAEETSRIQATLGRDMPGFEAADEAVHEAAVALHEAARARDGAAFVERLGEVQRGCVDCHERFRERLRATPGS